VGSIDGIRLPTEHKRSVACSWECDKVSTYCIRKATDRCATQEPDRNRQREEGFWTGSSVETDNNVVQPLSVKPGDMAISVG
jgi:hypothetical protein